MSVKKRDLIIWIIFCCAVFAGVCIFLFKYHPVELFDTDDWTYLSFTRQSRLLPSKNEWNPARILPENLMPLAGYIGKALFIRTGGFYDAVVNGMNLVLAVFICAYVALCTRMIGKKYTVDSVSSVVIGLFIAFVNFIPFLKGDDNYSHFFYESNSCSVFYYTIPVLLNAIVICLTMIHEEYIRHFFRKGHIVCKIVYLIMIYFAVYSNLYTSIVIAAFAAIKIIQYVFVEIRDLTTDLMDKFIQCSVYIYTLILWLVSMIFEVSGGRAGMFSEVRYDLPGAFKAYMTAFINKSIVFNVIIAASFVFYVFMLIKVLRDKDRYLTPLRERLKSTSKKKRDKIRMDESDELLFSYVNHASLWMLCALLTSAFLILLSAKTGFVYLERSSVQFDFFFFLLLNVFHIMAYLVKSQNKSVYAIAAVVVLIAGVAVLGKGSYREYSFIDLSNDNCRALANFIVQQYTDADKSGAETVQIHVPEFKTGDNFPIANYGNMRIAGTLYNYGITKRFVNSEFIIDSSVNEKFGL